MAGLWRQHLQLERLDSCPSHWVLAMTANGGHAAEPPAIPCPGGILQCEFLCHAMLLSLQLRARSLDAMTMSAINIHDSCCTPGLLMINLASLPLLNLVLLLSRRLLEEAQPILERASTAGKGAQLKAIAVEALSMVVFVGVEDPAVLDSVMAHMIGLWKGVHLPCEGSSDSLNLCAALSLNKVLNTVTCLCPRLTSCVALFLFLFILVIVTLLEVMSGALASKVHPASSWCVGMTVVAFFSRGACSGGGSSAWLGFAFEHPSGAPADGTLCGVLAGSPSAAAVQRGH